MALQLSSTMEAQCPPRPWRTVSTPPTPAPPPCTLLEAKCLHVHVWNCVFKSLPGECQGSIPLFLSGQAGMRANFLLRTSPWHTPSSLATAQRRAPEINCSFRWPAARRSVFKSAIKCGVVGEAGAGGNPPTGK